jgi:site-specific DNA recombinase
MRRVNENSPKRCAIYTRKSTTAGLEQEFNSLDAQREACEQYITNRAEIGWKLVPQRYDDGGFTGSNLERPAFQKLMQDVDDRKIDTVVVYKVDRLSRSLLDFAQVMHRFERADVAFVSVTQNFSTADAMGKLTLNMLMSFAEFEREMIAERTRDKMAAARRKGKWVGGLAPLGYRAEGGKLIVVEEEAELVRELFGIYQEEQSLVATAKVMNARARLTKRWVTQAGKHIGGLPWDKKAVYRHLTNITYIGKIDYKGEIHDGQHEGIVDEKLFRAVQSTLTRSGPSGKGARQFRQDFLLRGLLRCRVCGSPMSPSWSTSRGREYRYYVCTRVERSGRDACSVRAVPAGTIEDFVVKHIRTIAADPVMLTRVTEILQRRPAERAPAIEKELAQLAAEQQRCRQEGKRVLQAIGGNEARSDMTTKRLAELDERANQLEQRMAELRDEVTAVQRETVSAAAIQRAVALFDPVWDLLLVPERFRILHLLLESVVYDGSTGELELAFYPLGITGLAAEAAMIGQPDAEAAA